MDAKEIKSHEKSSLLSQPQRNPPGGKGLIVWLKEKLFSTIPNVITTIIILVLFIKIVPGIIDWAIISATFVGENRDACSDGGACWLPLINRFSFLVYGFYPEASRWRVDLAFVFGIMVFPLLFARRIPRIYVVIYIGLLPIILWGLLNGGLILDSIPSHAFGGFMLTFYLAAIGMTISLPVAIILALGRQSSLPVIRWLCIGYIEFIRSVPIVTFLFMASLMAQLFLPSGVELDQLFRVLLVMIFVSAAYKAEIIRGGIQGIPSGQVEASKSLGVGYWRTMLYIILPQALRNTVPSLINNFTGLVKETSLVMIVGLLDLTGLASATLESQEWIGFDIEIFFGISIIFFSINMVISRYGIFLEKDIAKARV
jgi:general L-amino acid transport system permease protein